jgi:hypothetical protein
MVKSRHIARVAPLSWLVSKTRTTPLPMKRFIPALACALVLAACASEPEGETAAAAARDCRSADAPTGSHMVRRNQCDRAARADGDAQRSAQQLQEDQRLMMPGAERR